MHQEKSVSNKNKRNNLIEAPTNKCLYSADFL